jgi:hypothetical protein
MIRLGLALFHTYPFKVFKYLSIGYIQWVCTRPHNSSSSTRCTKRCIMMSKNEGGNSYYNNTIVIATSFLSSPIVVGSRILAHSFLKTWHKHIMAILQPFDIRSCMHRGNISYIITCKSCDFIPFKSPSLWIFFSMNFHIVLASSKHK